MTTANGTANDARLTRETWRRFAGAVRNFATCEVRGRAAVLFGGLLVLLFGINGLNVLNSYIGRDFMTAIEHRDHDRFVREAFLYAGVFGLSTVAAVLLRFAEERFGLLWREWLSQRLVGVYLTDRVYHRLSLGGTLTNPDQRIAEDVRTFVGMTVSLFLMFLNGAVTVIAFSGVLWSISRTLFLVGIAYATAGSLLTVLLGRRLVRLNYQQADREADFRADLIQVRENAESVALTHREPHLQVRLLDRIEALVANMKRIIAVNRNLGFFTTGYNYMIQLIPALIVAPLFIRGDVEFGVITQSAMAFSHLLGAFSLVVTQFQAISSYAAVLARLNAMGEAAQRPAPATGPRIETVEDDGHVAYERLTLRGARDGRILVRDLSAVVPDGTRLLVRSAEAAVGTALMRATAGLWDAGDGRIVRPSLARVVFLPERPYVPPGTLRDVLGRDGGTPTATDEEIRGVLGTLGIEEIVARAGGLEREHDWDDFISLREQQLVSIARVLLTKPRFAFLDGLGRTIDARQLAAVLAALSERGITYVSIGAGDDALALHDAILDLAGDGSWKWEGRA